MTSQSDLYRSANARRAFLADWAIANGYIDILVADGKMFGYLGTIAVMPVQIDFPLPYLYLTIAGIE